MARWHPSAKTRHTKTIAERIDEALAGKPMPFYNLALALYPDAKSHRYQQNGGPPGCYMALSAALRRHNFPYTIPRGDTLAGRIVHPRKGGAVPPNYGRSMHES